MKPPPLVFGAAELIVLRASPVLVPTFNKLESERPPLDFNKLLTYKTSLSD
jgi:hypothetical protein